MDQDLTYRLTLQNQDGSRRVLLYSPHTSAMVWEDNRFPLSLGGMGMDYAPPGKVSFSPVDPFARHKTRALKTLKIQLGLQCNYSCTYCNQRSQVQGSIQGSLDDAQVFLKKLPTFYDGGEDGQGKGTHIEFWGGEPFAYWKMLRVVASAMRSAYPNATMNIVTNASLMTDEMIDWIAEMDIGIGVSHDGPTYNKNRVGGEGDPLDNPAMLEQIKKLYARLRPTGKIGFNAVLTRDNYKLTDVARHIAERLDVPIDEIPLTTEEIILPYDEGGMSVSPQNAQEQNELLHATYWEAVFGRSIASSTVRGKMEDFTRSLAQQRPSSSLGQKCGMDRAEHLAVDLKGNALTCQNTSATTKHKLGTVDEFDKIELHTLNHWMHREECSRCPVLQLCRGACFYLEGEKWTKACDNSFHYNLGMLGATLYYLTRMVLVEIEGPVIRREGLPNVISVIMPPTQQHLSGEVEYVV